MDYGVGIKNRYAFLEDDVEDNVAHVQAEEKEKTAKKSATPATDKKKADIKAAGAKKKETVSVVGNTAKISKSVETSIAASKPGGRGFGHSVVVGRGRGGGGRGGLADHDRDKENSDFDFNPSSRGNRSSRISTRGRGGYGGFIAERPIVTDPMDEWGDTPIPTETRDNGGGGRGRGGGRGSGYARGGGSGFTRRRNFDRLSGSDKSSVKPMDKREGAGAHNWGTYKDEIPDSTNSMDDAGTESGNFAPTDDFDQIGDGPADGELNGTGPGENGDQQVETEQPAVVVEPKTLTLEQWKAMQQPKSTPNFNIRKPNEGEDPSKWKNLILKKKENLDDEDEIIYEDDGIWVPQRAGRQKKITDIGFHFIDDREERGFRRGFHAKPQNGSGDSETTTGGSGNPRGGGFVGRGRGFGRGFGRDRQGGPPSRRDPPRVDDVREWPSLMC